MNIIDTIRVSGTDYTLSATSSGGASAVEVTQAEYDALVSGGTVDPTVFYIITDATPVDISNYWTSAQTNSAINAAVSGKQDTLSAGTGIDITDNVISATGGGGGGKTIEGGRGITVTSGETADTVSFNLPISAGTGSNSLVAGSSTASGNNSFAGGDDAIASGNWSFAFGRAQATGNYTFAANGFSKAKNDYSAAFNNSEANKTYAFSCGTSKSNGYASFSSGWDNKSLSDYESSFGYYNVSNKANTTFGDSGNTLFSVGNGTAENARHNAFEIRQNGDIYLTLNGQDVKLQDQLGGGGGGGKAVSGGTNISITTGETADTINCTLPITANTNQRKNDISFGNDIINGSYDYRKLTIGSGNKYKYGNSRTSESILIGTPSSNTSIYNTVNSTNCIGIGGNGLEVGYDNIGGYGSIAIGYGSKSLINKSLAIGYNTVASGTTQTNINNQLTIDTSNQVYISNSANTSTYCLQEKIENTESALGGLKLVKLTQSEYDSLSTKDNSTLYVVTDS